MRKLIKRYQYGGEYAMSKGTGYPNTTNVGAIDWSNASAFQKNKIAELPSSGEQKLTTESLGDLSIFNKGNGFLSKLGGGISNIFGKAGGLGGVASVLGGIGESFLPKRITSKGMDIANGILGAAENIPVYGKFATLAKFGINLIDSLGASKLDSVVNSLEAKEALAATGGGYGDFMLDWDEASELSGLRAGLFTSKSALNEKIHNANRLMSVLLRITGRKKLDDLLTALMGDRWNQATMNLMNGGLGNVSFGRLGLKIEILPKVHEILNKPKVMDTLTEWEEEIPEFKEGGKMNVIPEGSLHARLHHMENAEGLTKKGIPVVSIAEGGELELQAEIELNEIIFNLEVTTELEKLMLDGSDNAAIEAGKLLVKEIFENTDDRTGLIKLLEPEKKESTTEDIVKNHQVFQEGGNIRPSFEEWYKTVPKDRNNIENYNLKRAYELAPWEELERWRTATPELLKDDKYHLKTFYWNDKGEGEFVKKNGHPTLVKELEEYFTNKDFREKYDLDMSGDYFKYVKKK